MFTLSPRKVFHAAALGLISGSALLIAGAGPAMALCRQGTPNCTMDRNYNPAVLQTEQAPTIDSAGGNGQDPDCASYGNCLNDNVDNGCWYRNGTCEPDQEARATPPRRTLNVQQRNLTRLQRPR